MLLQVAPCHTRSSLMLARPPSKRATTWVALATLLLSLFHSCPGVSWLPAGNADLKDLRAHRGRRHMLSNAAAAAGGLSPALFEKDRLVHAEGFFDLSFLDPPAPADAASPPPDVEVRSGGLKSKMLLRPTCALSKFTPPEEIAKCPRPTKYDKVVIDFSGWQVSTGKMFDSSRLERMTLRVDDLFPGWQEGMKLMSPGETRRFWIPSKLAFGDEPDGNKPAGDVVLDVSLYDIVRQEKPPDAPADVGSVPEDATVLESGLAFKVLQGGSGSKASATSR
eukprot:4729979-Amphidinium_carterae.1